jgi:hypothetical protein
LISPRPILPAFSAGVSSGSPCVHSIRYA